MYSTLSTSNTSEMFAERIRAQAAERAAFGNSVLADVQRGRYSTGYETDVFACKDGINDGKISFGEKVNNFCNGIVAPIKNAFSSPKNIAITALTVAAGAGLIALTGGAAAPVMVALGLVGGGTQIATGLYKQATATTDAQAAQAWQQMGSGTFAVGASALGAKSALKVAGVENASKMSVWSAIGKCLTDAPKFFSKALSIASAKLSGTAVATTAINNPTPRLPEPETSEILALPEGTPEVVIEPVTPPKANPPRVIHLPEHLDDVIDADFVVIDTPANAPASQNTRLGLPAPEQRLGLPAPKPRYNPDSFYQQPNNDVIVLQPRRKPLGLPAPKVEASSATSASAPVQPEFSGNASGTTSVQSSLSKNLTFIKSFLGTVGAKIKESLNLFGIFTK